MSSGVAINPKVGTIFTDINARKTYAMILRMNSSFDELIVEKTFDNTEADPETKWNLVKNEIPQNDCCFIVTDFQWKKSAAATASKICLFHCSPEDSPIKAKMLYASSKEKLVNSFTLDVRSIQITEQDEYEYDELKKQIAK